MIVRQCDLAQISLLLQDAVATATDPSLNPPPPVVEASNGFVWSHAQVLAMRVGEVGVGGHQRSPLCLSCPRMGHYITPILHIGSGLPHAGRKVGC